MFLMFLYILLSGLEVVAIKAVITDVIYSINETSSEEEKPSSESNEKCDSLKVHHRKNITLSCILCVCMYWCMEII